MKFITNGKKDIECMGLIFYAIEWSEEDGCKVDMS